MEFFEVTQIGRESVKSVNATILATLMRQLVNRYEQRKAKSPSCRCYIKCKEKLEMVQKKVGDDEGFESDANEEDSFPAEGTNEDARSTASSCYLVEDHVFRLNKIERDLGFSFSSETESPNSIIGGSDSANSSGSSDTDELDMHSLTPSPVGQGEKFKTGEFHRGKKQLDRVATYKREEFSIADVIFCHTEAKYPTVIAWVIKKTPSDYDISSRLGKTGVESIPKNENCLEVIVIKCKTVDTLKELCSSYQEFSKRIKLDQYKSTNRRKDADQKKSVSLACLLESKEPKVSLSDMKVTSSGLIKASELSILNPKIVTSFQSDLKNSVCASKLDQKLKINLETKVSDAETGEDVPRKSQSLLNLSKVRDFRPDSLSKNTNVLKDISSGLNDHFNLVQRTDLNGVTHLEVSKGSEAKSSLTDRYFNKSKIRKEIEGVILTDADSYAKKEQVRQRQNPVLVDKGNIWRMQENMDETPPIRPERRKFIKKKGMAPSPPISGRFEQKPNQIQHSDQGKTSFYLSQPPRNDAQKIVKGQYIRVQSWGNQNGMGENNLGSWKNEPRERLSRKCEDKFVERRRSKSATRTTTKKTPMAYRYIDITDDSYHPGNSSRLYGLSQKIREFGGNVVSNANVRRRRNSFDDIIHFDNRSKGNLKSVIKKNKKINDKCSEPKKVTFSAFATVQVVD